MDKTDSENHQRESPVVWFEWRDIGVGAGLALLGPIAWLLPDRFWRQLTILIARASAPLRDRIGDDQGTQIDRIVASATGDMPSGKSIEMALFSGRLEQELQYLREFRPGGWHPILRLAGGESIAAALQNGRGAILWIAPQLFASLLVKKALCENGWAPVHLSQYYHGPSNSEFGRRFINVVKVRSEDRYLTERLAMRSGQELRELRRLVRAVRDNQVVSIACARYGRQVEKMVLLRGYLPVAIGAPSLALSSDAPLLPVFVRRQGARQFEIVVDGPLARPETENREQAVSLMIQEFGDRIEQRIIEEPGTFAAWRYMQTDVAAAAVD